MRISDWSSDGCSSDLTPRHAPCLGIAKNIQRGAAQKAKLLEHTECAEHPCTVFALDQVAVAVLACQQRRCEVETQAAAIGERGQIGRASCRERVCQYV